MHPSWHVAIAQQEEIKRYLPEATYQRFLPQHLSKNSPNFPENTGTKWNKTTVPYLEHVGYMGVSHVAVD